MSYIIQKVKYLPILSIAISILSLVFSCSKDKKELEFSVRKGPFDASIVETAELKAVNSRVITMPYLNWRYGWQYKIITLKSHGSIVKADEIVAEIDKSPVMKALIENQNRLETEKANLNKLVVQNQINSQGLKSEMAMAEASYNLAKLQVEKFSFETEKKQQIKKLEFKRAEIDYNKVKNKIRLSLISSEKAFQIQKIRVMQLESTVTEINNSISKLSIMSPIDGLLQLTTNEETRQQVKVGDNVWPGFIIAKVPNLSEMKITGTINETDIGKLAIGQNLKIRLDAYPKELFSGKMSKVGKISFNKEQGSYVKVFEFDALIDSANPLLKPGMTVSCEIFYSNYKDVNYIENECVIFKDSAYYLMLEKDKSLKQIKLGQRNNKFTVIYTDLQVGEKAIPVNLKDNHKL